jgi:hypothetical protein
LVVQTKAIAEEVVGRSCKHAVMTTGTVVAQDELLQSSAVRHLRRAILADMRDFNQTAVEYRRFE